MKLPRSFSLFVLWSAVRCSLAHCINCLLVLSAALFLPAALAVTAADVAATLMPSPPQLAASGYLLIDADSGRVLVENNADERLPPASLTKMMTSYIVSGEVAKGNISLDDPVPVSVKAWRMGGSKMFIREGTSVPVGELLRGVIIQSGNDASVALAEFVAGDESAFAEVMNQQAYLLGMRGTHFRNATGWPAEGHLTTARDLSLLARALINDHAEHYAYYSEKEFSYNDITQPNRNGLLWRDDSVDGIKTGHTEEAGFCLVASAKRNDMRLISVVMGAKSSRGREQETQKLLSYGFRYFETHRLYDAAEEVSGVRVWAGESDQLSLVLPEPLILTIPKGQQSLLEATVETNDVIVAPIQTDTPYGTLKVTLKGEVLARKQLFAAAPIAEAGLMDRLWDHTILFFRELIGLV